MARRIAGIVLIAISIGLLAGCVDRRYVVTTDPPGAIVLRNYQPIGAAPADDHFVYYGTYHFTLIKDGYATLQVDQKIPSPWYQYFPIDFFAENVWPWTIRDVRRFHFQLQPLQQVNTDDLLHRAEALRSRGQSVGAPPAPVPVPAGSSSSSVN
jgi:hypothetical protein